jgi:ketosteroid isomerase-like protein
MARITLRSALLVILTLFHGVFAMSQPAGDIATRNKALVLDRFNAWKAGTGGPFDLLTESATWTIVGNSVAAKTYPNRESFLSEVIRPFNARMKVALKPSIRQISADGDNVIIMFDAKAVSHDGKPYTNTYAWFFTMHEGKVVAATAFFDSMEFNDLWQRVRPAG